MARIRDRAVEFDHRDVGTPESRWHEWATPLQVIHFADLGIGRIVVIAPHPDDESLGAGGTIASLSALGIAVDVVVCSDGAAAAPPEWLPASTRLDAVRRREVTDAVEQLSTDAPPRLTLLGLPDGRLAEHRDELAAALAPILEGAALIIAPWSGDGHPDHEAVARAVADVADTTPRLDYPVWAWHWAEPHELHGPAVRIPISPSALERKSAAIACHRSQTVGADPVLGPDVRRHFERDHEIFLTDAATLSALRPVDRSSQRFFEALHRSSPSGDPWEFGRSAREQGRHEHLERVLSEIDADCALEIGCSTGHLTRRLSRRTSRLVAVDSSPSAIEVAARTCAGIDHVELRVAHLPAGFTTEDDGFDLVVMSEVGYYFTESELGVLLDELVRRSTEDALLLAAHWTGESPDHVLDAATTHAVIGGHDGWTEVRSAPYGAHLVGLWRRR